MLVKVDFGSNRELRLSHALLLYSYGSQIFATLHMPENSPDGGPPHLGAGQPLTAGFIETLADGLGATVPIEILPENVLVRGRRLLVWFTKARPRTMFYSRDSDGRTLNGKLFPQPTLLFKVEGSELFVRALRTSDRPRADTTLMCAPYWNTAPDGRVCQGSMRSPDDPTIGAVKHWEEAFFESEFTHAAVGTKLTSHREGFLGLWRDLAGSRKPFPTRYLVASGQTLGQFVNAKEG